ncbi:MAG: DUF742 domain-containing protein [Haloechinothrix sp.]
MGERVGLNEPELAAAQVPPAQRTRSLVRPYARTGGRTRPDHNLALEAMVSTSEQGRRHEGVRTEEHRIICDFCVPSRTLADIVSELRLPLGVVKVIVADMAHAGLVRVHQPGLTVGDRSSREFMERLLRGLHNL